MQNEVEKLLSEIADAVKKELRERCEDVKRIVANLAVSEEEYVQLMVDEILSNVHRDAKFAFPPHTLHTPEKVKQKALELLQKKLKRDIRLFACSMEFYAFKFRPSSHSEDYAVIAEYEKQEDAEKAKRMLLRMLEDMEKNLEDYDADWRPEGAHVTSDGKKVIFKVYTAGYLDDVMSVLRKVAKPSVISCYANFQKLEVSVSVPGDLTLESAIVVLDKQEAEAIRWFLKNCGKPLIERREGQQVFKWLYEGEKIYDDEALHIGFEFPLSDHENWRVEIFKS